MNIFARSPINTRIVYYKHSFRSDFSISKVKHCFEATYVSGCIGFHAGFSPQKSERVFVSYTGVPTFSEYSSTINTGYNNELEIKEGETVMVCLNSETSLITAKINNKEKNHIFSSNIGNSNTWYAYLDAAGICASPQNTTLKINLGKNSFINSIPEGYAPFIYGYYDKRNFLCTRATPQTHLISLYSVLILMMKC